MRSVRDPQSRNSTGTLELFSHTTLCSVCNCNSLLCCPFMCALCFPFLHDCSAARDLKASIQSQAVMVLCSHLPQTVLGPKLKDLQCRQVTTLSDAGHDTTASLDGCSPSTSETETDVKELERKELVEDLHAQSMSSPSKRWLKYKRGQSSSGSASSLSKRRKRRISDDSSNASSTAIPEQQDGGVQANVSKSPLKSPRRPAAARGDPFICVLDSEEEGGEKTTEAVEELQEGEDLNTVASICEVFELP